MRGCCILPFLRRAGVQMRGGARGGWLPATTADGSLTLCMLLVSFFTRMISEIKFTHVVFCDDYWMTGKEKEGKRGLWQSHLVDILLLLISVSKIQIHVAIPLAGAGFSFWSSRKISCKERIPWETFSSVPLEENGNNYKISEPILSNGGVSLASLLRKFT